MSAALFGVSVTQIGLIFDTILASFLPHGSVSWLYSRAVMNFPLALFGISIATVMLPVFLLVFQNLMIKPLVKMIGVSR